MDNKDNEINWKELAKQAEKYAKQVINKVEYANKMASQSKIRFK